MCLSRGVALSLHLFMKKASEHIHPIFHQLLQRADKEQFLKQKAVVVWFTGLSGSGKSTIARELERQLHNKGYFTKLLDGDNVRTGINKNLGFSEEDRTENIRRIAEVAKLFLENGVIVLCSFVSPTRNIRAIAKEIIGAEDFMEVFVNCPLEICEERDVKGLYKKARAGEIRNFTGIDAPFEEPETPAVEVNTESQSIEESTAMVLEQILPRIVFKD